MFVLRHEPSTSPFPRTSDSQLSDLQRSFSQLGENRNVHVGGPRAMEDPIKEFPGIIQLLVLGRDGKKIQHAINQYYCPDMAFAHPLARFESAPNSRETLKDVWAVYKVACWGIRYTLNDLYWDKEKSKVIADLTYDSLGIAPFLFTDVRFISMFELRQSEEDGLYRIQSHWDCYPIDSVRRWKVWGVPVSLPYWIYLLVAAAWGKVVGSTLRKLGWF